VEQLPPPHLRPVRCLRGSADAEDELRHTSASLAIAAGAGSKAVQRMLGYASAAMTLDVYAGLFGQPRRRRYEPSTWLSAAGAHQAD
jgi:integrase